MTAGMSCGVMMVQVCRSVTAGMRCGVMMVCVQVCDSRNEVWCDDGAGLQVYDSSNEVCCDDGAGL